MKLQKKYAKRKEQVPASMDILRPPPPPLDSTPTGRRLIEFYTMHNPKKLNDPAFLKKILQRYKGRETKLFADLHRKYKVKPQKLNSNADDDCKQKNMKPKLTMHDILGSRLSTGFNNWVGDEPDKTTDTVIDKENMFGDVKQAKRERQRKRAIQELLSTEKTYVDLMSKLVEHYVEPLRANGHGLSVTDSRILFPSDIHAILGLNQTFLRDLSKVIQAPTFNNQSSKIGDILFTFCPHFKMYQRYCNNYNAAATRLAVLRKKIASSFCKYCNKQVSMPYFNNLTLEQLLILPIQRMPRYKLLLQEIIKYTETNHPDLQQLNSAFVEISKVNISINDRIKIFESRLEVQSIENRFGGKVNNLVIPSRRFIYQGRLCKIEKDKHEYYWFILFSDCILCATIGNGNKLTLGNKLFFDSNFSVEKTSGSIKLISNLKHLFELHSTNESFFLYAENKQDMEDWVDFINETYNDYMESGTVKKEDKLYAATLFIPYEFALQCMFIGCSKKFTMTNRRYSCKYCGFVVCGSCSTKKLKIKNYQEEKRVCDVCYKNNKNNQLHLQVISQKISMRNLEQMERAESIHNIDSTMQKRYEELLVTGFLRQFLVASKKQKLLGIKPKLPQRLVYLCNVSYGSIKRELSL